MNKSIKIIGCGGIGSYLLPPLCRYLNFKDIEVSMMLVDGDSYELRNAERQVFNELGNKAQITANRLLKEFPKINFRAKKEFLTKNNIHSIIRENDTVFMCVDNHATRKLLFEYCNSLKDIVVISGGNEYIDGNVNLFIRKFGKNCNKSPLELHPEMVNPTDKNPGELTDEEREGCEREAKKTPQLVFMNNTIATIMCNVYRCVEIGKIDFDIVYCDIETHGSRKVKR